MPGMMDTVLNLGLNDETVKALAKASGSERFAYDSYRRFLQMFSDVVLGADLDEYEGALEAMKKAKGYKSDTDLTAEDLKELVKEYKEIGQKLGKVVPQDPVGSAVGRHRRRIRFLDGCPRDHLSQTQQHPRRLGYGR